MGGDCVAAVAYLPGDAIAMFFKLNRRDPFAAGFDNVL